MAYRDFEDIEPVLFNHYVQPITMASHTNEEHSFSNFLSVLYCTDVKFQPYYGHGGPFNGAKHYFSGKQKLYGLKLEYSVAHCGFADDFSKHSPESVWDFTTY